MKTHAILLISLSLLTATACSTSDDVDTLATDAEGIYLIDSYTQNLSACAPGGESLLGPDSDVYAVVFQRALLGTPIVYMMSCASPADCRAKIAAFDAGEPFPIDFSYGLHDADGDTLIGGTASTGFSSGDGWCTEGSVSETALTVDDAGFSFVEELTLADDYRADADGFCTTDLAKQAAAGNECGALTTLTATYVEPL